MTSVGLRQESCQKCGVEAMDGFLIHHPKGRELRQTSVSAWLALNMVT